MCVPSITGEASTFSGHEFAAEAEAHYGSVVVAASEIDWPNPHELGTIA